MKFDNILQVIYDCNILFSKLKVSYIVFQLSYNGIFIFNRSHLFKPLFFKSSNTAAIECKLETSRRGVSHTVPNFPYLKPKIHIYIYNTKQIHDEGIKVSICYKMVTDPDFMNLDV